MKSTRWNWSARFLVSIIPTLMLGSVLNTASGQENRWTGTTDANWSVGGNWTAGVPTTGHDVVFVTPVPLTGPTISVGAGSAAKSLLFEDNYVLSGGDLTIASGSIQVNNGAAFTLNTPVSGSSDFAFTGSAGSHGVVGGGISQSGGSADFYFHSGSWAFSTGAVTVADDLFVQNPGTLLTLGSTGVLQWGTSTSNYVDIRNGATVKLGADDAIGSGVHRVYVGHAAAGDVAVLDTGGFEVTTPRIHVGNYFAGREGHVKGGGTITVTNPGDAAGINLYRGTVEANLTGAARIFKGGSGTVTVSGTVTSTGAARMNSGTLILDYTTNNDSKLPNATLDLRSATLVINGNASDATVQDVASTTLANNGAARVVVNAGTGQDAVLNLGTITRGASAGTVRFQLPSGAQSATRGITTSSGNNATTGLLGSTTANSAAFAVAKDDSGTWFATRDGAGNNIVGFASIVKNDVATWVPGDHVTDSGSGFTGALGESVNLHSLRFDAAGGSQLNLAGAAVLGIVSGGILVTDEVTSGAPGIFGGNLRAGGGTTETGPTELVFFQDSPQTFTVSSGITGNTAITKAGAGTLRLTGANTQNGILRVQQGTLETGSGNAIGNTARVLLAATDFSMLRLTADEAVGSIEGGTTTDGIRDYAVVDVGSHTLTLTGQTAGNRTFSGQLQGTGTIIKTGSGVNTNQNFNNISTGFTGSVIVNGGLFQMNGIGRIDAASWTVNKDGALLLDNNGSTRSGARVLNNATITLNSADGSPSASSVPSGLWIRTDQNSTSSTSETIGALHIAGGANYARLENSGGTGSRSEIVADNFIRTTGATLNVRGRNLGDTADPRTRLRIGTSANQTAFIASNNLVGGGTGVGTTTQSIVPWTIGERTTANIVESNMGNSLVTYISGRGFVALDFATEYTTYAAAVATSNVRESLAADLTGLVSTTLNALVLHNDSAAAATHHVTGTGAGQALAVTSGAMLFTLNPGAAAGNYGIHLSGFDDGITVGSTNEYIIHVVNPDASAPTKALTATISSPLNTSGATLTKSGRGTLVLDISNSHLGAVHIAEGTLQLGTGGTNGSIPVSSPIVNHGTLALNRSDTQTQGVDFNSAIEGVGGFHHMGSGMVVLNGANTYSGTTTIDRGVLRLDSAHSMTGGLVFGSTAGLTTTGRLEVNEDAAFGGLLVQTHSTSNVNQIAIAAGKELIISGDVVLGSTTASSTTRLSVTGEAALRILNPAFGALVAIGNTAVNRSSIDASGLDTLEIDLNTTDGLVRIGSTTGSSSSSYASWLALAKDSTIRAATLTVGAGGLGGISPNVNELRLGTGANVIHVNTFNVGTGSRDTASIFFPGATGTLEVRAADGVEGATFNLGASGATTGNSNSGNNFDVTGHNVDLLFDAVSIGTQNRGNSITHTFSFDQGTLAMASLTMATRTAPSGNALTTARITNSIVNIGGGTTSIQNGVLNMGRAAGNYSSPNSQPAPVMNATINVTGGDVSIGATDGVAVRMAEYIATGGTGTGSANGHLNISGGNVAIGGDIVRVTDGVNATATVTLDGGSLDMTGNSIGTATHQVTFNTHSGTLANLGELNGGGTLVKSSAGMLVFDGTNDYTGPTWVDAGTLLVNGTHTGGGAYTVGSGATLGGTGSIGSVVGVNTGGRLAPGASIGTLAIGNHLTMAGGSVFEWEFNSDTVTADLLNLDGHLDLDSLGGVALELIDLADPASAVPYGTTFTLISYSGEWNGGIFDGYANNSAFFAGLNEWKIRYDADLPGINGGDFANFVTLTIIPEPTSLVLLLGAVLGLLLGRRRRG
ncbi:MAG: autotransporter-associated beta strand repeat-containing protein [Thermoguttaceae bacterium]|jgi:autotransporter-associated beta strand protein|nr:autotransporter-associated beta strand repeat-containing protein [Thermoguttaceae bacterium]